MTRYRSTSHYFPHAIQISAHHWHSLGLGALATTISQRKIPVIVFYRQLALKLNRQRRSDQPYVQAGLLNLYGTLHKVYHHLIGVLAETERPGVLRDALRRGRIDPDGDVTAQAVTRFVELFPPEQILSGADTVTSWLTSPENAGERRQMVLAELLLLRLAAENPAIDSFREILDDKELARTSSYPNVIKGLDTALADGPFLPEIGMTLGAALRAPIKASPNSLAGQIGFIRENWYILLPPELLEELTMAFDILLEEERGWSAGGPPGPPPVMEFGAGRGRWEKGSSIFGGYDYPEYERFSPDADWMSNVVMMAKMVYVWLDQLSRQYDYPVTRLDQVPDAELDRLARAGFTALWLIGLWERSPASERIKQLCGNPDAIASAYSLYDYEVAGDLGGWEALVNLRDRAMQRGIRLASDMVPNHTGIYSRWVIQHPDWFVQTDYPPFPSYQFNGEDLSHDGSVCLQIEDGYWAKTDAAVVFKYYDRRDGRTRYIYHGNDGTSIPWNDTAQLNYLIPEVREAVLQTILHVARNFPIIRFDAAMTLAKKHYQRLWYPIRGIGGGIPSRAEHGMTREEFDTVFPVEFWREVVDRVAVEVPGTLLLAEAFWLMEGYFVRTLGMHRVYNSAFMNMLKMEDNAKYRQTIRNVLEFNPEVLKRFVNFMNNPDERTAVEQFGTQGKYFGACVLLATMPGLPMFGHGQIEGFHEKYGMEYKRAYWDEKPDEGLVRGHEMWIFPLLRRRWLFSGSENFFLYDFYAGHGVDENVFAYSNRMGDQRALVIYHNSHAKTAGWIRESAAFAVKNGNGDDMELRRTDLGYGLGIEPQRYIAFRDVADGQEYLRNSDEMREKGLFVELGEYQFHVFLDFRTLSDEEGHWAELCTHLSGRGVESLDDELKQLRFADLNSAFSKALDAVPELREPLTDEQAEQIVDAAEDFVATLNRQLDQKKVVSIEPFSAGVALLQQLVSLKPSSKGSQIFLARVLELLSISDNVRLLLAWVLLSPTEIDPQSFGLDLSLRRMLLQDEEGAAVPLLQTLLACKGGNDRKNQTRAKLEELFAIDPARQFMQVHESEGIEWFNKERFEDLSEWLMLTSLMRLAVKRPASQTLSAWFSTAEAELKLRNQMAAHAGYRTSLMLSLELDKEKAPKKTVTPKKPAAAEKKGKDVKGGNGTRPPRTPHNKIPR